MDHTIQIERPQDDELRISIDGNCVGFFTHDSIGWDGLEAVECLAESFAQHFGIEIEEIY